MTKSFIGNEVVLKEKDLYAEGDAGNPKKVNIVLGDTPAMIFEFETKELANKMIDWIGANKKEETKTLKYESGQEYGWLSASEESKNPCDIGYDESGGCSYGKH
ncbi:hypothetical protein [Emticicia sp. 17c]|uniref:hypothetical protein n=1 Tax=Emticicia sp. 17c TaxID=3127704 RepID=UPI00301E5C11